MGLCCMRACMGMDEGDEFGFEKGRRRCMEFTRECI